jgi:hypothetical protein
MIWLIRWFAVQPLGKYDLAFCQAFKRSPSSAPTVCTPGATPPVTLTSRTVMLRCDAFFLLASVATSYLRGACKDFPLMLPSHSTTRLHEARGHMGCVLTCAELQYEHTYAHGSTNIDDGRAC